MCPVDSLYPKAPLKWLLLEWLTGFASASCATITCVVQVAGFFVQTIPDWIGWLKYVSFIYYGYNTLLKVLLLSFRLQHSLRFA